MTRRIPLSILVILLTLVAGPSAYAHFGMLIPSDTMIMQEDLRRIQITMSFSHPMELIGMDMVKPEVFNVIANGTRQDLKGQLTPIQVMDKAGWKTNYQVKRPGLYVFYVEPQAYWEPAEDCFIIHHTKTVVSAFGDDEGWDAEIGLKTEIVPLAKPFGLYAGNIFQGVVKLNGKPVPHSTVEVEFYNQQGAAKAPTDYMITQTIKADQNGVFSYSVPHPGWWGFAALNPADFKRKHGGQEKDVELGAVIWIKFHAWQTNK